MGKTIPLHLAVVLVAGLTTACGEKAARVEDGAENTVETQALEENAAVPDETVTTTAAVAPAVVETAAATVIPAATQGKTAPGATASLPLKLGHYVRAGTPCNRASRADIMALVTPTGMSQNCTFKKIEKTGATTYRVTSACSDGGAAWGREDTIETMTDIYEIPNDTSYTVKYEGGSEVSARHCAQVDAL
ncbi:MAG TPA: hypothetical protein VFF84_13635 [Sphingobium sp.]|nr:hypothetical protein [Sphingobium sp.]